jgi:hypothetical protein
MEIIYLPLNLLKYKNKIFSTICMQFPFSKQMEMIFFFFFKNKSSENYKYYKEKLPINCN